jgi:hypothetical protein
MNVQCIFKCVDASTSAWIEEKHAKVGKSMLFKDTPEDQRRWEIVHVCGEPLPKSSIDRQSERFITHAHPTNRMRGNK